MTKARLSGCSEERLSLRGPHSTIVVGHVVAAPHVTWLHDHLVYGLVFIQVTLNGVERV